MTSPAWLDVGTAASAVVGIITLMIAGWQTRKANRENAQQAPYNAMVEEVRDLRSNVDTLNKRMDEKDTEIRRLYRIIGRLDGWAEVMAEWIKDGALHPMPRTVIAAADAVIRRRSQSIADDSEMYPRGSE